MLENKRNQTNGCLGSGVEGNKETFVGDGNFLYLNVVAVTFAKMQNLYFTQMQFTERKYLNKVNLKTINILDYVSHQTLAVQECCAAATRNCPVCKVHNMLHLPGKARDVILLLQ